MKVLSNDEMQAHCNRLGWLTRIDLSRNDLYRFLHWKETLRESAVDFLKFVEKVRRIDAPDHLRIVFAFDN